MHDDRILHMTPWVGELKTSSKSDEQVTLHIQQKNIRWLVRI